MAIASVDKLMSITFWQTFTANYGFAGQRRPKTKGPISPVSLLDQFHFALDADRQERWQYIGTAGSDHNSYANILPPLQFLPVGTTHIAYPQIYTSLTVHFHQDLTHCSISGCDHSFKRKTP